ISLGYNPSFDLIAVQIIDQVVSATEVLSSLLELKRSFAVATGDGFCRRLIWSEYRGRGDGDGNESDALDHRFNNLLL
ncbi:hypothetical protein ACFOEA_18215, partial [Coralloluteibacterium stylophorae]